MERNEKLETKKTTVTPIIVISIIIVLVVAVLLFIHKPASQKESVTPTNQVAAITVPSDNIYLTKSDSKNGSYLTDFAGMTLYTFDKDSKGVSNCTGACVSVWKPYTSGATSQGTFPKDITIVKRVDGIVQFSYKNAPLYYNSSDSRSGDVNGNGVTGVWHIVKL